MITEDYVSFETAKLLREKGFNENCDRSYVGDDAEELSWSQGFNNSYYKEFYKDISVCSAPRISFVMKWLREMHNLFIAVHPRLSFTDYYWITADIYRVKRKVSLYHTEDVDDYDCVACCDSHSYEEASEAAIKYCLEKLI